MARFITDSENTRLCCQSDEPLLTDHRLSVPIFRRLIDSKRAVRFEARDDRGYCAPGLVFLLTFLQRIPFDLLVRRWIDGFIVVTYTIANWRILGILSCDQESRPDGCQDPTNKGKNH